MATASTRVVTVRQQRRLDASRRRAALIVIAGITLVFAALATTTAPQPISIALLVLVLSAAAAFVRPVAGVYLIVLLSMIGDDETSKWWPFLKNLSSRESILYVHDALILNPLEIMIAATLLAWIMHRLADPTWTFRWGRLLTPLAVFTGFVTFGVLYGQVRGGVDTRIAVFEFRPLFYLFFVYLLVSNLLTTKQQYVRLLYLALAAIGVQSIFSLHYYTGLSSNEREYLEALGEHAATIGMNAAIILVIAVWTLGCRHSLRWRALLLLPTTVVAYVLAQRRAAAVALIAGIAVVLIVVFYRRPRTFWFIAPTIFLLGAAFVVATWNATGAIGLGSSAVKTVLFPNQVAGEDRGSDQYRVFESLNLWFTMRSSPLLGIGFGHRFYKPYPLADLSFFEFYEFIPHNNVIWIWLKTGFGGFVTMLYTIGRSIQLGARSAISLASPRHAAVVVTGAAFVLMFLVFAYVDIAFGGRTMVLLAFSMALCGDFESAGDDSSAGVRMHTHQLAAMAEAPVR